MQKKKVFFFFVLWAFLQLFFTILLERCFRAYQAVLVVVHNQVVI